MIPVAIVTLTKDGRPSYFYLKTGTNTIQFDIFRVGQPKKVSDVFKIFNGVKEVLSWAMNGQLISPNIGSLLRSFELPELSSTSQCYDVGLPAISACKTAEEDAKLCENIANLACTMQIAPYQSILAKAQSAYCGLERSKLLLNYELVEPKWCFETFSGRSKSTGFNIQGWSNPDRVRQPSLDENVILLHFDWICADLRAASVLSQDPDLVESFVSGDPYTYLSKKLVGDNSMRDNAKILLLKTINSLDHDNELVEATYPKMCGWLGNLLSDIHMTSKSYNIVGRPFTLSKERNERSLLNAVLQGSVASAMQSVVWNVKQLYSDYIVCDIHDGLVLSIPKQKSIVSDVIDKVSDIFSRPFKGILDNDPFFPYRISVGETWKEWKEIREVRLK